jgi:DHA1 family bicyclomycin/chloramphenicol resistance-like MFS transporter
MTVTPAPRSRELIAVFAILMATVALSIDVMLPALGDMATELSFAEGNARQWVIILVFLGLSAGQLIFGPLSDAIGRKPAIAIGAGLFTLGSLGCALSSSFEMLLLFRFLQGLGAAGPRLVTIAMIRDRFSGAEMARVLSIIMGIFIMVPVLGPTIGQGLLFLMPWRGLFAVIAAVCVIGVVWLSFRQPETLATRRPLRFHILAAALREVITDRRAMAFTGAAGLCYGAVMGYVNASQQVFQEIYAAGDLYAPLFGAAAAFISAATITNSRLVRRIPMERICRHAVQALTGWSALFAIVLTLTDGLPSLWLFMGFNAVALFFLGLTFGNFQSIALENLGHVAGLASAVTMSLTNLVGMATAGLIGLRLADTLWPLAIGFALSGALAYALMGLAAPRVKGNART